MGSDASKTATGNGRPVRLELNSQRATAAFQFYQALFGWTSRPLHVPPWGSIPLIANGDRVFGNQFMAMGAFAQSKWLTWFSADLEHAKEAIERGGGDIGNGIYTLGEVGEFIDAKDPHGHAFSLTRLRAEPPATDQFGDPCLAEFWGRDASRKAEFFRDVLDLTLERTPHGAMLTDNGAPRLFFRDTDFDIDPPRWIPYFKSAGVGGDCERARRAGAIVQVHREVVSGMGALVVLSDPAGTFFGIVNPDEK